MGGLLQGKRPDGPLLVAVALGGLTWAACLVATGWLEAQARQRERRGWTIALAAAAGLVGAGGAFLAAGETIYAAAALAEGSGRNGLLRALDALSAGEGQFLLVLLGLAGAPVGVASALRVIEAGSGRHPLDLLGAVAGGACLLALVAGLGGLVLGPAWLKGLAVSATAALLCSAAGLLVTVPALLDLWAGADRREAAWFPGDDAPP